MTDREIRERWETLLYPERFRDSKGNKTVDYKEDKYPRNPFDSDFSRITLSSPFRRLQDKAQVFPLEKNDFARTRLTHSVEVSGLARSIGVSVENILHKKDYIVSDKIGHIPSILSVAGLIHDIGNPPFGHFGEDTIKLFFKNLFKNNEPIDFHDKLIPQERADFEKFDGNVQGLRILLRLGLTKDEYSYNLTFPTLSSIIKYPYASTNIDGSNSNTKYGYFQSDKDRFNDINIKLELDGKRHPLVFLLEAADDIAYSVSDIEDGCKKGTITWEILMDTLKSKQYESDHKCKKLASELEEINKELTNSKFPSKLLLIAQECRIKIQIQMIPDIIKVFMDNHEKILNGEFTNELLEKSDSHLLRCFTKEIAKYNFNSKSVAKMELLGENVLTYLLEIFVSAVLSEDRFDSGTKNGKLFNLISGYYKYRYNQSKYSKDLYNRLMLVTDYISGMTDTYALTLYHELLGLE